MILDTLNENFSTEIRNTEIKKTHVIWRGIKVTLNFLYETPALVIGVVVAGLICQFIFPVLAPTLYTLAVVTLCSKLTIKILSKFNLKCVDSIEVWVIKIRKKFTKIQLVSLIITIIVGSLVGFLGIPLAFGLGIYNGLISEIDYCKKIQQIRKYQNDNNEEIPEISNLISG